MRSPKKTVSLSPYHVFKHKFFLFPLNLAGFSRIIPLTHYLLPSYPLPIPYSLFPLPDCAKNMVNYGCHH